MESTTGHGDWVGGWRLFGFGFVGSVRSTGRRLRLMKEKANPLCMDRVLSARQRPFEESRRRCIQATIVAPSGTMKPSLFSPLVVILAFMPVIVHAQNSSSNGTL